MNWVRSTLDEVIGLFIDDGAFALVIVVVVLAACLLHIVASSAGAVVGLLLVAGTVGALVVSVARAARTP